MIVKLRAGLMPPAGRSRPAPAARATLVGFLEAELDRHAAAAPNPGRTEAFHRLNRAEYRNAVRDLLGLGMDMRPLLPSDDASYGFDNIAGVLKISQSRLEQYLTVARRISRAAIGSGRDPEAHEYRVAESIHQYEHIEGLPFGTRGGMHPGSQVTTPLVHDGVMYLASPNSIVQALDAATGDLLWEFRDEAELPPVRREVRGVAIYEDKIYLNTADARIIALDMRTGKKVWDVQVADSKKRFRYSAAALIVRGMVISGLMNNSFVEEKNAITAHDARTGQELWRTRTVALPGEPGGDSCGDVPALFRAGADMWITGGYDPELDLIYWSTAQAKPWTRAARGTDGDALYSNTTLALDPDDGKIVWYRQWVPGEQNDMDEVFEHVLIDHNGRKSLFKMGKLGILWEADRRTGQFLNAIDLGYQNLVDVDPKTGKVTYRPGMTPVIGQSMDQCPSLAGLYSWRAMAYHPDTRALYGPLQLTCTTVTYADAARHVQLHDADDGGRTGVHRRLEPLHRRLRCEDRRAVVADACRRVGAGWRHHVCRARPAVPRRGGRHRGLGLVQRDPDAHHTGTDAPAARERCGRVRAAVAAAAIPHTMTLGRRLTGDPSNAYVICQRAHSIIMARVLKFSVQMDF